MKTPSLDVSFRDGSKWNPMWGISARKWAFFISLTLVCAAGARHLSRHPKLIQAVLHRIPLTKGVIAEALGNAGAFQNFPSEVDLPIDGKMHHVVVQYAFDPKLQESMKQLIRQYSPDYGAFVAIDAATGRVLSMVSYTAHEDSGESGEPENLTLRSTFPSASVFKVVTAAAVIQEKKLTADTMVSFNGRNHTLYRSNILKVPRPTRWTRYLTLKAAFAQSVNTVFGKLGAFDVGATMLGNYADRFGFNRKIEADVPIQEGHAAIQDDPWALAETASGFTRDNTMSPFQGALIAATVANGGVTMEPYAIDSIHEADGTQIYVSTPQVGSMAVDEATAQQIRELMHETIVKGTSRKSFRGFFKGKLAQLEVGGKTGSLTGLNPKGKYDWFVGFARGGESRIAVAALTVNEKNWKVKSSFLARKAFEAYFKDHPANFTPPAVAQK